MDDVVIVSALRTPITKVRHRALHHAWLYTLTAQWGKPEHALGAQGKRGGLKDTLPDDMLTAVFQATLQRTGIDPAVSSAADFRRAPTRASCMQVLCALAMPSFASLWLASSLLTSRPTYGRTLGTSSLAACWATAARGPSSAALPPCCQASPRPCPSTP